MQQGRLRLLGTLVMIAASASLGTSAAMAQARLVSGKLAGVVRDLTGTPQMGASVEVFAEAPGAAPSLDYLTNTQGIFRGERLTPGLYTIRVTLAGFLPTLQQHVRINPNLTTMVRIEMESMFASLEQLRRPPNSSKTDSDDWKWVLRSAAGTRPVLQWDENAGLSGSESAASGPTPKILMQFTDGAKRTGSVSNVASAPGTAFAYDQRLGGAGSLLVAGQMSYLDSAAGGVATMWLPAGNIANGPHTAVVLREAQLGNGNAGITFRGMRIDQGGAVTLGDRVLLRYGGEYVLVGLGRAVSSVRPRLSVETKLAGGWRGNVVFASQANAAEGIEAASGQDLESALVSALDELDAFPVLMWRDGRPVMQGGWHEEISAERRVGENGKVQIAAFHEDNQHLAVFGRGNDLPPQEYFEDVFSNAFAYDGGASSSWGGRVAYREKLNDDLEVTALYAMAGALAPGKADEIGTLRDALRMMPRHSVGVNVSSKLPRMGGRITAGYKWISGPAVSRVDSYGESLYQMDPYLHVSVRQQLPKFGPGRWEAIADCDNLLAQGYVTVNTREGQVGLVPAFRTFRGGLSLQF